MRLTWVLFAATVAVACKRDDATPTPGGPGGPGGATTGSSERAVPPSVSGSPAVSPTAPTGSDASAGSASAGSASMGSASVAASVDPKIMAARCDEPCLFLLDTPVDHLGDAYKAACGKDMAALPFDDCAQLDQLRKCIYAAHGFVFKQKQWKTYEQKPWYTAHPEFTPAQISQLERANVRELDARAKGCKKGLAVSTADLARVKAWIAGLAAHRAALPRIMTKNGEAVPGDELLRFLAEELSGQPLTLDGDITVAYERELPSRLVAAIQAPAGARLRSIMIDHGSTFAVDKDNSITEGVQIHMIYDDHDVFLGIDISHYLYD